MLGVLPKLWWLSNMGGRSDEVLKHRPHNWKPTPAQYDEMAREIVDKGCNPEWGGPDLYGAQERYEQSLMKSGGAKGREIEKRNALNRRIIDSNMALVERQCAQLQKRVKHPAKLVDRKRFVPKKAVRRSARLSKHSRAKLLTTKRCARNSKGTRLVGKRRVTVCCPPGKFHPRAKRKCAVVRRRLVK